jgi:hypothetical protein
MGCPKGLTTGECKRYKAGILTEEQAQYVSARSLAQNPSGWGTWGKVLNSVGLAAASAIPYVGGAVSQFGQQYEQQRFADIQRKANFQLQELTTAEAKKAADARRAAQPPGFLEYSSAPWTPNYGRIGQSITVPGYAGGTYATGAAPASVADQVTEALQAVTPWQWAIAAGAALLLLFFLGRR